MAPTRDRTLLATVVFVVLLAQVLLYPGIDSLVTALGARTPLGASTWFLAAEFLGFIVFAPLWGAASDRSGRRVPYIAAGAVGGAIGYVGLAVLPSLGGVPFAALVVLRVLQGGATIAVLSLSMTMLMDLEGGHGRNMGAAGIAIGAGTALGAPLGGQLYEIGPFVPLYAAGTLLGVVLLLTGFLGDRSPEGSRHSVTKLLTAVRDTPTLLLPYTFGFLDRLTAGFFALVGTLYFRTVFDLSPGATGLMLALFFAPFALLQYPMGVVSDRIGRTIPIVMGSVLYGVGVIGVGQAPTVELAGVGMVAVGICGAIMAPATMALVTDLATRTERGVAMAGFNVFGSLGFLAGIVVGGMAVGAYGYGSAFVLTGGLELLLGLGTIPIFLRVGLHPAASVVD
jgi:MFS family permease